MEELKLSKKYSIYKLKYNNEYPISDFLKLVEFNHNNTIHTNNNSAWIEIESPIFDSINNQVKQFIEKISHRKFTNWAQHHWVYTQRKGFDMEWMHQHIQVHPPGRSKIQSDYTFTFYLQTTDEIKGDEGKIVFQDEHGIKHSFLPNVGDIFIFGGDIRHTAIPTPNSNKERIVYAGSYCVDIYNQKNYEKTIV
tara:strand:- start:4588 stop:5169 length:582 start_codon:yes stop_codon:yes gene_type:complete